MKVDRARILEFLRGRGHDDVDAVRRSLPLEVDTDRDRAVLDELGVNPDELVEGLGKGGLGKMIGG